MTEKDCYYVCSRGLLKSCDVKSETPVSSIRQIFNYDWSNLYNGCTIYICSSAIPHFKQMIDHIPYKFILVSGDCDECCPMELFSTELDFETFIKNDNIIHWFSQNLIIKHPKMTQIPIGLDYHTMTNSNVWGEQISSLEQEKQLLKLRNKSKPFYQREPKIYSNFHFFTHSKFGKDRVDAIANIPKDVIYYEPEHVDRIVSWQHQTKYAFVASPHGNGLDCHRTWEALCLNCIVIVKTSPLDDLYKDLPVLIVPEWSSLTESLLLETIDNFKNVEFSYEKLTLSYWMNLIRTSYKDE
jgi:hypothetical protein